MQIVERSVGLGRRRGNEESDAFGVAGLKGLRLSARVRFAVWGDDPAESEGEASKLTRSVLGAEHDLRQAHFLRCDLVEVGAAEGVEVPTGRATTLWRTAADFDVLFEFPYVDLDEAGGLITLIHLALEGDEPAAEDRLLVRQGGLVCWHGGTNHPADLPRPPLEVRGGSRPVIITGLAMLALLPTDAGPVTVAADWEGGPAERHFATLAAFRDAFTADPDPVVLGGQTFESRRLSLPEPRVGVPFPHQVRLQSPRDFFRVNYDGASIPNDDIVYLVAIRE